MRTDARRSPYFRDYRKEQERHRSTDTVETTTLVTRLAGLLWAIVDQATAENSTRDTGVATEPDADRVCFTERTASKTDFGTRAEPVDGLYGYTPDGDPVVPERGQLMRARTNANGQPADALLEPDAAGDLATWTPGNASANFVDPTGKQIVGVASGLDESATRTTAPEMTAPATVDDLQAYDRPEEIEDDDTTTGIKTADLEVLTPSGEYVRLGDLLVEPEQFAGTSLESIECYRYMSEDSITVEELAEKADEYLHETSLTPEEYEALKHSIAEFAPIFSTDRAYFILGSYGQPEIRRLQLVKDRLNRRPDAYAFLMVDVRSEWTDTYLKFRLLADYTDFIIGVAEHARGGFLVEQGYFTALEPYFAKTHVLKREYAALDAEAIETTHESYREQNVIERRERLERALDE